MSEEPRQDVPQPPAPRQAPPMPETPPPETTEPGETTPPAEGVGHWRIGLILPGGALLELASETEPRPIYQSGRLVNVEGAWLKVEEAGIVEEVHHLKWESVLGLTIWQPEEVTPAPAPETPEEPETPE